ncbi:hypothetical protein AB0F72_28205 [Actinoplanes sp. NPDC023936]|uniref:hypothetical protein n=1 Tax=Actinoplanes sp. NPDC023936 TaxID=3154910 RepID=UPI0033C5782C
MTVERWRFASFCGAWSVRIFPQSATFTPDSGTRRDDHGLTGLTGLTSLSRPATDTGTAAI